MNAALLVLWVTGRCNLCCSYCYAADAPQVDLPWEAAKTAIDRMKGRPFRIQFTGGEPLLNLPLIRKVAEYVAGRTPRVRLSIQTNATLVDEDSIKLFREHRIAVGVSLDGLPSLNERTRGLTSQTIQGINRLAKAGILINLNAVLTSQSVPYIDSLADMAVYLGNVHGIGLDLYRPAMRNGQLAEVMSASPQAIQKGLEKLHRRANALSKHLPRPIIIREIEEARNRLQRPASLGAYCYAAVGQSFVVLPDERVFPCGSLLHQPEFCLGIVSDPWRALKLPNAKSARCNDCLHNNYCPGGCPARTLLYGGDNTQDCALRRAAFNIVS